MQWIPLENEAQLARIKEQSANRPQVILKYSTRCSISAVAKNRLDKGNLPETIDFHFLDLLAWRSLSNKIAEDFRVYHESPQVLLIKNGQCVYNESHLSIDPDELLGKAVEH